MKTLGEKLWSRIETAQGFAFISDDLCERDDEYVANHLRAALRWQRKGVQIMARLLREYEARHG